MSNNVLSSPENIKGEEKSMLATTDINHIKLLYERGWGSKRISKELGISRRTVKKYIKNDESKLSEKSRPKVLDGLETWLANCYQKHRGNADVIRQELLSEHQIKISLRTVERAVKPFREVEFFKTKANRFRLDTRTNRQSKN
jgi:transposase